MRDRWGVALTGHEFDIADALECWGSADSAIRIARVQDNRGDAVVVLFADDLDKLSTAGEVEARAFSLVDRLNGALFVRDPRRQPIKMSGALERTPQSSAGAVVYQHQHVLRGEVRGFRVRIGGTLSVGTTGDSLTPTPAPRERNWIDASLRDEAVADALAFLRGDPGWFDLYKAFEVMDVDVQHRCEQGWQRAAIGWPSKTAIKRFTQSAQPHRHSRPAVRQTPKGGWMPLDEAKPFVARFFSPGPTGALRNLHQPATAPPNLS